ncbi:hypothetical protein HNP38_002629 [Chryseobacterium defluvii]|uniref:Uncharacterized protein n=1 Tax=Chryseobacterium defluvii TaxID=160396 RepID=A0A840KFE8_9FLAO|nr:hypothetical protein [Chryseobacterium defluvii]MBB4807325.1 hypothetical protein [Chryseobacterium defluvii]
MIQFILMLFGLAFSGDNASTIPGDNSTGSTTEQTSGIGNGTDPEGGTGDGDTGGNTGQKPPEPGINP